MGTTATCVYKANAAGQIAATLANAIQASSVPVDPFTLEATGATVATDVTAVVGSAAVRTIVLNLTPAFKQRFPDTSDQRAPFWAFMQGLLENKMNSPVITVAPVIA